ncbi:GMC family oxidoreductase [Mycobacterium cookii]|uniref:GMC oxidoreductase n=1 Tax=Mycobacterium cookii TaxID=1775 RepID=A0A7I7KVL7_9MYCO|nr:GMC oxidoreductase [Mycobacterium cookii]MCV7331809.1 GMC family oxidoreductase [Mycobacterium cookii]BBX46115.1 GMC oxidoreductase [Mycobacterium cookii]
MIVSGNDIAQGECVHAALVVIGAGPAGIVCALEAAKRGVDVVLIETGNRKQTPEYQELSTAHRQHPDVHAPVEIAVSRQLGGTSSIWGGRCVPYDRVDFVEREITPDCAWPVTYEDVQPYFERACQWMLCGRSIFDVNELDHLPEHMIPGLEDGAVSTSSLERWSLPTDFGKVYFDDLRNAAGLKVITDATCVQINLDDDSTRATDIECRTIAGNSFTVAAEEVIVAAGGLESTRLLMCSPGRDGRSIGDHSRHLGHWYMAHLEGVISDLALSTPAIYGYERDRDGSYVRRRFAFVESYLLEHDLPNISGWIANPELADASHRNAQLSLTYLALISPLGFLFAPTAQRLSLTGSNIPGTPYGMAKRSSVWAHIRNLLQHPIETVRFLADFGIKRVFGPGRKPPGFFVGNPENRYPFQYHAEHLPHYDSCVQLVDDVDAVGMPKLNIDILFTDEDIDGVLAAHRHWDNYLRASGIGRLEYVADDLATAVRARTGGGFHQVGTTRMSKDADKGVVDENLAVHGVPNVHVVSSSVFVTSGQANSTFMIVVFALRLIERLYGARQGADPSSRVAHLPG